MSAAETGALLGSDFAGLSYEKSKLNSPLFSGANTALVQMFRLLGPSVLRIGGDSVDTTSWKGAASALSPVLPESVDALAAFARATGWSVIYGINMADNTVGNIVDEASYAAAALGASLLGFEIGNEPDLYPSNGARATTYTFSDFNKEWIAAAAAIRQAVPNAVFTGPSAAFSIKGYTVPFARAHASDAALLTQHYYRANGQAATSTLELLLQPDPTLTTNLQLLASAASANALPLGYRMAECNSFYHGGAPNASDGYGTALWALDYMFTCALAQCRGVNFHGGGNGTGYTPIADSNGIVVEARPVFYGMAMFAQLAQGHAVPADVTLGQPVNFTGYGVMRGDGGTNILLINKETSLTVVASVDAGPSVQAMTALGLIGPGLSATAGLSLGGAQIDSDGTWLPQSASPLPAATGQLTVNVPPLSAMLLRST